MVKAHKLVRHLTETVIVPGHIKRRESAEFRRSKKRLKADGHYQCWTCGTEKDLQVHHYGAEWSEANDTDFIKLKAFCEEWDMYGYGRLLRKQPMTSVDDIRNLQVLCQQHHTGGSQDGAANGIHEITFPAWVMQKLSKRGKEPVPQNSDDPEEALNKEG